jgi:hypothetical protein
MMDAADTMLDFVEHLDELPPEQLAVEMMGLLEAVDFEYERFAEVLHLEISPDTDELFQTVHADYAATWNAMGTDPFMAMMTPVIERWRVLVLL